MSSFIQMFKQWGITFFDVKKLKIDFLVCSAHKNFMALKALSLHVNKNLPLGPMITGGSQERNHRGELKIYMELLD